MLASDFDFDLPSERIARYPADRRDQSRLMVLDRTTGAIEHRRFADLPQLIERDWTMVFNDARVLAARLLGRKKGSGGRVELLLVEPAGAPLQWRVMAGSSKPLREQQVIELEGATATVERIEGDGFAIVALSEDGTRLAQRLGTLPLPPYLGRSAESVDADRYQTVFSDRAHPRSIAAPTAGLHFTDQVLSELDQNGVRRVHVTLDVGPGTFLPVRSEKIEEHVMHRERFVVSPDAAAAIEEARRRKRVMAVGTTVVRTLESMPERVIAGGGETALFIKPGFSWRVVDRLLTNFHLPRSTLLMLVSAFAGREKVLEAYRVAVAEGYRFFSYGDAMLIR